MEIDRGLKIRIAISVVLTVVLLAYFVEKLSYRSVVANPREPANSIERVIESCDDGSCVTTPEESAPEQDGQLKSEEGALIRIDTNAAGV